MPTTVLPPLNETPDSAGAPPVRTPDADLDTAGPPFGITDLGLVLMAVIWGVNFTVVKAGLATMAPLAFNGLRVALAAVVLALVAFSVAGVRQLPSRRDTIALLLMGLVGNGLYQLAFIAGLARTRAGIAALVIAAGPAWIALFSQLAGRERLSAMGWGGIALQLAGMLAVVASAGLLEADNTALLGAGFIMLGSIAWAIFTVMLQPYTRRVHPLHLASITLSSGAVLLLAVGWPALAALDLTAISPATWGAVVYAGVGALVIAYLLFYRGVRVLGPTRTAVYSNLQPVIALAVAWLVLAERPTTWQIVGGTVVMAGLLVSRTARMAPLLRPPVAAPTVPHSTSHANRSL